MRFLSVCSGIEAASVAWNPLGWKAVAFSEIEPFPCAVLAHHYPDTPNWGDMTKYQEWPLVPIDLLCGGTPCQSFSVAGLRKGLADPRGNLMLTFGAIAARYRPRWLVWENVPGVLSSNGGRDFGAFLGMLGQLGYGFAYRVLDAQYAGLAQRRKRVFVVGCLGDWRSAAAVLLERHSLSGHPAPGRKAGQRPTGTLSARTEGGGGLGTDFDLDGGLVQAFGGNNTSGPIDCAADLNAKGGAGRMDFDSETFIAHSLRGERFDASEDGTGRGTPLVPVAHAFDARQSDVLQYGDRTGPLDTDGHSIGVLAFSAKDHVVTTEFAPTLQAQNNGSTAVPSVMAAMQVRRLTVRECERLQGFPDDYTLIPFGARKKLEAQMLLYLRLTRPELSMDEARRLASDGPRYKALGNSWAVPCARWIGQRIEQVESAVPMLVAA